MKIAIENNNNHSPPCGKFPIGKTNSEPKVKESNFFKKIKK